jgi:hypothetical protein
MADKDEIEPKRDAPLAAQPELPVVTRLVIEIRSDGSRTIARGAVEDARTGEKVELRAEGATPLLLLASLLRSLGDVPSLVKRATSRLLAGKQPKDPRTR